MIRVQIYISKGEDALTYLFTYSELTEMIQNIQLEKEI